MNTLPETIKKYAGAIVATSSNWNYKVTIYKDGSASLDYIARPNSGCDSGIWCGLKNLRQHMNRNAYLMKKASAIPEDWKIIEPGFFEALDIK